MGKEAYYFSHDSNARNDEKILMLRAEHGSEGYGIYWVLVEMMFESSGTSLHHNKVKGIAVSSNIDITVLEGVINTCITEELFVSDGTKFWSESLKRRKGKYQEMKEKKSIAGRKGMAKRWGKQEEDNGVITDDNTTNNSVITKDNKGKERKINKSKVKESNYLSEFETFWKLYPKRIDRKKAYEKFQSAAKIHDVQLIIDGARKYAEQCHVNVTQKQFIKHPTTFLNAESFLNDFELTPSPIDNHVYIKPKLFDPSSLLED